MNYRKFKADIKSSLLKVDNGLMNGTLNARNVFIKHPNAMLLLGTADTAYYRRATHNPQAPSGIYPIEDLEDDVDLNGDPKQDRLSVSRIVSEINGLLSQFNELAGEDLADMLEGNSDSMAGSTSSEWTAEHSYSQF